SIFKKIDIFHIIETGIRIRASTKLAGRASGRVATDGRSHHFVEMVGVVSAPVAGLLLTFQIPLRAAGRSLLQRFAVAAQEPEGVPGSEAEEARRKDLDGWRARRVLVLEVRGPKQEPDGGVWFGPE